MSLRGPNPTASAPARGAPARGVVWRTLAAGSPDGAVESMNAPLAVSGPGTEATRPALRVRDITKRFGRAHVLSGVSLDVADGELVAVLGPSGCGKTTLLRVIAGLERPDAGAVWIEGRDVSRAPPASRGCGVVFQSYALFPNLTARQNVAFAIDRKRYGRAARNERVDELLGIVSLSEFAAKYPHQLSGGQQQRVALARALASSPTLLLLDEPLSALDAKIRERLRGEIRRLQRMLGLTTVMVTHDQDEALTMADRIVVMDAGRVAQVGTPREVYQRPGTAFVADFMGTINLLTGWTRGAAGQISKGAWSLRVMPSLEDDDLSSTGNGPASLGVAFRPEDAVLMRPAADHHLMNNCLPVRLERCEFRGPTTRLYVTLAPQAPQADQGLTILVDLPSHEARRFDGSAGMHFELCVPPDRIRVFADPEGRG